MQLFKVWPQSQPLVVEATAIGAAVLVLDDGCPLICLEVRANPRAIIWRPDDGIIVYNVLLSYFPSLKELWGMSKAKRSQISGAG